MQILSKKSSLLTIYIGQLLFKLELLQAINHYNWVIQALNERIKAEYGRIFQV